MKTSTGKQTKAEQKRFDKLRTMGCICCALKGLGWRAPEMHHLVSGGRRIGHAQTLPLCPFHHRNVIEPMMTPRGMSKLMGPSFGASRKAFEAEFGSEESLLAEVNRRIGQ